MLEMSEAEILAHLMWDHNYSRQQVSRMMEDDVV